MLKCAECGCAITSEIKQNKWIYYHCTGNYGKCSNKSVYVREEVLDEQFNEAIKNVTVDEHIADYLNMLLAETYKDMEIQTKDKNSYLRREIEKIKGRQDKLLDIYIGR